MKAYLVYWSPATRVVVPDDATEEHIKLIAWGKFNDFLLNEYDDHIEKIVEDIDFPYDPEFDNQ